MPRVPVADYALNAHTVDGYHASANAAANTLLTLNDDGEVALVELADYARGSVIRSGAADWEALAHPGTAYHLQTDANDVTWSQNITMADDAWIGIGAALERIVFDAAGDIAVMGANFGVGIAAPLALTHIRKDQNATTEFRISNALGGAAGRSLIRLEIDAGLIGAQIEQLSAAYTPVGMRKAGAMVVAAPHAGGLSLVADDAAGDIRFYTGGALDADEHATLLQNGYFGLGVQPAYKLDTKDALVGYVANFFNDGGALTSYGLRVQAGHDNPATPGVTYWFYCLDGDASEPVGCLKSDGGVFSLANLSDERRKVNIEDTKLIGLDIINGLKVRDFNWKANPKGTVMTSFVAQEAQEVYPDMVGPFEDGTLGTSQAILIPILTKAIQELDVRLTQGGL